MSYNSEGTSKKQTCKWHGALVLQRTKQ